MDAADTVEFACSSEPLVREVLDEYGDFTRRGIQHYLPRDEPRSYLYELLADYPRRGGKMMRSSLCIAMARATGAEIEDAMPSAVAIELLHNALLVHDDIEDASDERRGTPTLHALHGVPLALNAGDAMGLLSLRPLKDNVHRLGLATALRIFEETERMAWESAEGQALELGWQRDNRTDLSDEDYLRMVLQKTCWLATIHPMRVGCLIGARGRIPLDPLIRLGFFFGAAFQIQDDLLNLDPGPGYGKEAQRRPPRGQAHADDHPRPAPRRPAPTAAGWPTSSDAAGPTRSAADVAWLRTLLDRTGALEHARTVATALSGRRALRVRHLLRRHRESRDRSFIRSLILWVTRRTH